jgi:hypothetical protein
MKKIILIGSLICANLFAFSQANNALSFDGDNDVVIIANQPLKNTTDFTIEAQILNENISPDQNVFMQFYDVTNNRFELRFDNGMLSMYSQKLLLDDVSTTFTVPVGTYFHFAMVKSGTTTKMYVDGTEVKSFVGTYFLGSGLQFGRYFTNTSFSFKGQMDEIRMWNVAKSISAIEATPKCGLVGNEANLVGYWDFNQGLGSGDNTTITTLIDKSASKINGTLTDFALTGTSSNWIPSAVCPEIPNAITTENIANAVKIFPNPANNWIEIKGADNNSEVEIYSVSGQLVMSQEAQGRILFPSSMENGMYVVHVKGNSTQKFKIVKQ